GKTCHDEGPHFAPNEDPPLFAGQEAPKRQLPLSESGLDCGGRITENVVQFVTADCMSRWLPCHLDGKTQVQAACRWCPLDPQVDTGVVIRLDPRNSGQIVRVSFVQNTRLRRLSPQGKA
ncbi:MAG: hypothetical protein ACI867_002060, partial [Glaciecola sp.]